MWLYRKVETSFRRIQIIHCNLIFDLRKYGKRKFWNGFPGYVCIGGVQWPWTYFHREEEEAIYLLAGNLM